MHMALTTLPCAAALASDRYYLHLQLQGRAVTVDAQQRIKKRLLAYILNTAHIDVDDKSMTSHCDI
jgi:hypothetical protein